MKIAVLGYGGSGKSYISNYISKKKNIPVLHLDEVKFDKEWKPVDDSLILSQVADFMAKDNWIIDGYYKYLLIDERLKKADKIILLLLPPNDLLYPCGEKNKIEKTGRLCKRYELVVCEVYIIGVQEQRKTAILHRNCREI
ncbi:MAG: hypothetical protein IJZ35_04235 [Clostridia bacterium]|nr:hypothetical protein [Clostridia bacterium]